VLNGGLAETAARLDETVAHPNGPVRVSGTLGGWKIAAGGSGRLVKFTVPCANLDLSQGTKSFGFKNGDFLVEATLEFTAPPCRSRPGLRTLGVVAGQGAVTAQAGHFTDPAFAGLEVMAVSALQVWLDAQTAFPYDIADIVLADSAACGPAQALLPVTATYAYADTNDGDGVLALLCAVAASSADTSQLLNEVDPGILGAGASALALGAGATMNLARPAQSAARWAGGRNGALATVESLVIPVIFAGLT
jgi:hypothetical protein